MKSAFTTRRSKIGRWFVFLSSIVFLAIYGLYTLRVNMGKKELQEVEGYIPINTEIIEEANYWPIQSGGRVKPLVTWAKFLTYSLHGSSSLKFVQDGERYKIGATEIVLQCMFRPDFTEQLDLFRIEDKAIVTSLSGSEEHIHFLESKQRRDLYSYQDLKVFLPNLIEKSEQIYERKSQLWTNEERQTVNLTDSLITYYNLSTHFDFARRGFQSLPNSDSIDASLSEWMESFEVFLYSVKQLQLENKSLPAEVVAIWSKFEEVAGKAQEGLHIIPKVGDEENWNTIGVDLMSFFKNEHERTEELVNDVKLLEEVVSSFQVNDEEKMKSSLVAWNQRVSHSLEKGFSDKIHSEVTYTKSNYFFNALIMLFPALLFLLISWVIVGGKVNHVLNYVIVLFVSVSCLLVLIGITHRSILMERPPIGNLFDTIIFIAGLAMLILLIIEWMTKKTLAMGLSVFLGITLLFLARRYEIGDGKDHLDPLVAVLDSNFWLATHVVTITLGYMGGLVAAGISATYILGRFFKISEDEADFRKTLTRMCYGMLGFTLLFSLIGTVLGGIWANDSWGRFWGWDPKENGALMIVLWCLILLHARLAGFLREWGLHICTVLGANVVVFSWWHVNSLSTGLHSYGFIEGINAIWGVYGITSIVAILGLLMKFITKKKATQPSLEQL